MDSLNGIVKLGKIFVVVMVMKKYFFVIFKLDWLIFRSYCEE